MFSKLSYAIIKKWEIKLCISDIYHRVMYEYSCFQNYLCYDKKWEIKLCISVNIYHRLPKFGMSTHVLGKKLTYNQCYDKLS